MEDNKITIQINELKEHQRVLIRDKFKQYNLISEDEDAPEKKYRLAIQLMLWTKNVKNLYEFIAKLIFNGDANNAFILACLELQDNNQDRKSEMNKISWEIKKLVRAQKDELNGNTY